MGFFHLERNKTTTIPLKIENSITHVIYLLDTSMIYNAFEKLKAEN